MSTNERGIRVKMRGSVSTNESGIRVKMRGSVSTNESKNERRREYK